MFLIFGLWMLFDGALGWRWPAVAITGSVAVVAVAAGLARLRRRRRSPAADPGVPLAPSPERS